MKFARYAFFVAGIYGLFATFPLYFMETSMSANQPPALNHREYYYSFISVTLAWQVLFFLISRTPLRFRSVMIFCAVEKLSLLPAFFIVSPRGLFPQYRKPLIIIDLAFGVLFIVSYLKTKETESSSIATAT
jgi:hypothetical protein